jgi:hypothetical protein
VPDRANSRNPCTQLILPRSRGRFSYAACVVTDTSSGGRVVVLGFPLESLDDPSVGAALVALLGP